MKSKKWAAVILAASAAAVVMVIVIFVLQSALTTDKISETQDQNTQRNVTTLQTLKEVQRLADRIESCTTPDAPCSQRNAKNLQRAISAIRNDGIDAAVAAAYCADAPGQQSLELIRSCTLLGLSREVPAPKP